MSGWELSAVRWPSRARSFEGVLLFLKIQDSFDRTRRFLRLALGWVKSDVPLTVAAGIRGLSTAICSTASAMGSGTFTDGFQLGNPSGPAKGCRRIKRRSRGSSIESII